MTSNRATTESTEGSLTRFLPAGNYYTPNFLAQHVVSDFSNTPVFCHHSDPDCLETLL
jgi:hypothetical protein